MSRFPNPERSWHLEQGGTRVDRAEVEARLGPVGEPLTGLSGGLANDAIRVGGDRVLRIYRRNPRCRALEAELLSRPWRTFRVPRIEGRGPDHLLLEFVPNRPIEDCAEHGSAIGGALAEIHTQGFESAGWFGDAVEVVRPLPDLVDALAAYISEQEGAEADRRLEGIFGKISVFWRQHAETLRSLASRPTLLHGDFKASNLFWTDRGELLVLDWEFAYAGAALMEVGQLFRWGASREFEEAFAAAYLAGEGKLPAGWRRWSRVFDLANLAGLLADSPPGSRRETDLVAAVHATLEAEG